MRNPFRRRAPVEQHPEADFEEEITDLSVGDPIRAVGALVLDSDWPELPSMQRCETPAESARWIVAFAEIQDAARRVDPSEAARRFDELTSSAQK